MLTHIRRSTDFRIRLGLGLIVVASIVTVVVTAVVLIANAIRTAPVAVNDYVPAVTLTADSSVSAHHSPSVERARKQIASLVRADDFYSMAVDWAGLTLDMALTDMDLLPTKAVAHFEALMLMGNVAPAAADWSSRAPESAQAAYGGGMASAAFAGGTAGGGGVGGGGGLTGAAGGGSVGSGSNSANSLASRSSLPIGPVGLVEPQGAPSQPSSNGGQSSGKDGSSPSDSNGGAQASNGRAGGPSVTAQAEGDAVAVPEPSTLMLASVGLISLISSRSRRRAS